MRFDLGVEVAARRQVVIFGHRITRLGGTGTQVEVGIKGGFQGDGYRPLFRQGEGVVAGVAPAGNLRLAAGGPGSIGCAVGGNRAGARVGGRGAGRAATAAVQPGNGQGETARRVLGVGGGLDGVGAGGQRAADLGVEVAARGDVVIFRRRIARLGGTGTQVQVGINARLQGDGYLPLFGQGEGEVASIAPAGYLGLAIGGPGSK